MAAISTGTSSASGDKPESPLSIDRDVKAELLYLVVSIGVWMGLMFAEQRVWAVAWFMATFFMFGIWRIARGRFE